MYENMLISELSRRGMHMFELWTEQAFPPASSINA